MDEKRPGILRRITGFFGQSWVLAIIVVIAVAGWMASGMFASSPANGGDQGPAAEAAAEAEEQAAAVPKVRVRTFRSESVADQLRLLGRTEADRHVTVRAETGGTIAEIFARRGTHVEEGQVILRIDEDDRGARVASAKALVAQRQAEFEAARQLNKKGYRGDVDLSQAQAALDAAHAQLELANIELDQTVISAPFAGVLNDRPVELGDFVDRGDPVATIVDLSVVTAIGQVSERNMGLIETGQPASVQSLGGKSKDGVISYVGSVADAATRTFPIEVDVPNADGSLIEGVTVELTIPLAALSAHSITPAILTLADDGTVGVRSVDETDHVVFHPVQILRDTGGAILVGGLPDEVRLITVGQEFVRDGQKVEPVEEDTETPVAEARS